MVDLIILLGGTAIVLGLAIGAGLLVDYWYWKEL